MIKKEIVKMFKHFPKGIYIKSLTAPMIHGLFKSEEKLREALEDVQEDKTLYFLAHELVDIDFVPVDRFEPIQKGKGIKMENISRLRYGIIDIDPVNSTEAVNGINVKRNLTKEENRKILKEASALRAKLLNEGFDNIGLINSGNGAYLLFPFLGVKNPKENIKVFMQFVEILKKHHSLGTAQIDTSVIKVTQPFKLPGTLSSKGTPTKDNPFRYAEIVEDWDAKKSCWKTIKEYVDKNAANDLVVITSAGPRLDIDACMLHCQKVYPVYRDKNYDYFVRVKQNGIFRDMRLSSPQFVSEIRVHLRNASGFVDIPDLVVEKIITYLIDEAYQKDSSFMVSRAFCDVENKIVMYDMCNGKDVVKITPTEIRKITKPLGVFRESVTDKEQVEYVPTPAKELPRLLSKFANVIDNNLLILATFLCVCFLGNFFPTAMLLITGAQGTSKSTLTRFIQRIVHPQKSGLFSLAEKKDDIAIALSSRLLTCFDNASGIKAEISDLLCSAVTKGCMQKRKLYTDSDEVLLEYNSIMVINGIEIVSRRTDLMQRCLMLELEPIKPENRKTEHEVEATFNENLPMILGAIFDAIQQVLNMGNIELATLSRMADFEAWAVKFAIAMGYAADEYQKALKENQQKIVGAVSFGNPVIFAVVEIMRGRSEFNLEFSAFYTKCYDIVKEKLTPNELSSFPKKHNTLSRALGGMEENLKAFGITFKSENVGPFKEARFTNDGSVIPNSSVGEVAGKLAYEKEIQTK